MTLSHDVLFPCAGYLFGLIFGFSGFIFLVRSLLQ